MWHKTIVMDKSFQNKILKAKVLKITITKMFKIYNINTYKL